MHLKNPDNFFYFIKQTFCLSALLKKLEKRIAEVRIDSKELGFTKPGAYIYELLEELGIKHDTATMLLDTIEDATILLEEGKHHYFVNKTKINYSKLWAKVHNYNTSRILSAVLSAPS